MKILLFPGWMLLLFATLSSGHYIRDPEYGNPKVYQDREGPSGVNFVNPNPSKPTLRELLYYHIIERPQEEPETTTEAKPLTDEDVKEAYKTRSYLFDQMRQRYAVKRMAVPDSLNRKKRQAEMQPLPDAPSFSNKDAYVLPKTYGMNLNPEGGYVWNNLNKPATYYELEPSNGNSNEGQHASAQSQENIPAPSENAYIPSAASGSSEDIYVSTNRPNVMPLETQPEPANPEVNDNLESVNDNPVASDSVANYPTEPILGSDEAVPSEGFANNPEVASDSGVNDPVKPILGNDEAESNGDIANNPVEPKVYENPEQSYPVELIVDNPGLNESPNTQEAEVPQPESPISEGSAMPVGDSNENPGLGYGQPEIEEPKPQSSSGESSVGEKIKEIPEAPTLSPLNYDNLPDFIRDSISSTEKPVSYKQTDNPYINPQPSPDDKKAMEDKMEDIFATMPPVEEIPKTYGMNLTSDGGQRRKDDTEEQTQAPIIEQPEIHEEPENPIPVPAEPEKEEPIANPEKPNQEPEIHEGGETANPIEESNLPPKPENEGELEKPMSNPNQELPESEQDPQPETPEIKDKSKVEPAESELIPENPELISENPEVSPENPEVIPELGNEDNHEIEVMEQPGDVEEPGEENGDHLEEPASYEPTDNPFINAQPSPDDKKGLEDKMEDIFTTMPPVEDIPKTYGVNLTSDEGHVWNDMVNPPVSYDVETPSKSDEYHKEDQTQAPIIEQPEIHEEPENPIPVPAEPKSEEPIANPEEPNQEPETHESEETANPIGEPNPPPKSENEGELEKPISNPNQERPESEQEPQPETPEIKDKPIVEPAEPEIIPENPELITENPKVILENSDVIPEPGNEENHEIEVTKQPSDVAEPGEENRDYLEETPSYEQTDNPYINPQPSPDDGKTTEDKMEDKFTTMPPVEDKPKTYGMNLTSDEGHVWNDMVNPPVSYDVGTPSKSDEDHKEEQPEIHEEPENPIPVPAEPETEEPIANPEKPNQEPETHESEETANPIEEPNPSPKPENEGELEKPVSNPNQELPESEHEPQPETPEIEEKPIVEPAEPELIPENPELIPGNPEVIPENPELIPENPELIPENPELIPENPEVIPENPEVIPEPGNEDNHEIEVTEKPGDVEEPGEKNGDHLEEPEHEPVAEITEEENNKPDIMSELLKSEQFWKWLGEWTATYMEQLEKHIRKIVIEEICKREKSGEKMCPLEDNPADTGVTIKNGKIIVDGREIDMKHTDNLNSELKQRQNNKHEIKVSNEKMIDVPTIYGDFVGNGKVTNVFIFNADKAEEVIDK